MKILFVLPSLEAGGAEKVVITLANELALKYEVTLFSMLDRGALFPTIDCRVKVITGLTRGNTFWRKIGILGKLIRITRQQDVVVAGLEVTATYFTYLAAIITRKPMIAWVHTLLSEYLTLGYFSQKHTAVCRWLYRRIKNQVFVSEGAKASMLRLTGDCPNNRYQVIYNPLAVKKQKSVLLTSFPQKPFILAVGRLAPEKGFDFLLSAFARLREKGENVALLILGEGPMRETLTQRIRTLKLEDSVHLLGYIEEPSVYYQHATVFALSSRIEGLSMVLLEAMQSGVSIVATQLPSVNELLGDEFAALEYGDIEGFANALQKSLHEPVAKAIIDKRCVKARSFTPQYAANLWETLLKNAIRK